MNVTGVTNSRLNDLKKYTVTGDFFNKYKSSTSSSNDGVNEELSQIQTFPKKIVYYIDTITYTDIILENGNVSTTFSFVGVGYSSLDFVNGKYYKDPSKGKIIQNPKVVDDVFIDRQELSVYDKIYKLQFINDLNDLVSFAGGQYFKIISNT
jgi:hypothetical protein